MRNFYILYYLNKEATHFIVLDIHRARDHSEIG